MRNELFFAIISFIIAGLAMMLGDHFNLIWREAPSAPVMLILTGAVTTVILIAGLLGYYDQFDNGRIHHGFAMTMTSFGGGTLYGLFNGPINNGGWAWFDGWAILLFVGLVPVLQELNETIRTVRDERAQQRPETGNGKVMNLRRDK